MANDQNLNFDEEQTYRSFVEKVFDLQSLASDIGIERQEKQSCIFQEERDKSLCDNNKEDNLKIIKQTTDVARLSMNLIIHGLQICALYASRKSKQFNSLSSTISFFRQEEGYYSPPKHLLLEWERNVILIDLFTSDEGLYCNKRIAQDMFDICMETFNWLRSLANNNK